MQDGDDAAGIGLAVGADAALDLAPVELAEGPRLHAGVLLHGEQVDAGDRTGEAPVDVDLLPVAADVPLGPYVRPAGADAAGQQREDRDGEHRGAA